MIGTTIPTIYFSFRFDILHIYNPEHLEDYRDSEAEIDNDSLPDLESISGDKHNLRY